MIAFSGLMPMAAGVTPTPGGKRVGQANRIDELTDYGQDTSPLDQSAGSFMEWVQTLMDARMPALTDGQQDFDHPGNTGEPNRIAPEKLQAMFVEAPAQQSDQQMDQPGNPDIERISIPAEIITADPTLSAPSAGPQVVAATNGPAAGGHPSATDAGQLLNPGDAHPTQENSLDLDDEVMASVNGLDKQKRPFIGGDESRDGIDRPHQANQGRLLATTEGAVNKPEPVPVPQQPMTEQSLVKANDRVKTPALSATTAREHEADTATDRSLQGRSSGGSEIREKALDPAAGLQAPMADRSENMAKNMAKDSVKDPAFITAADRDQKEASSSDDTAKDRGRDEHRPTRSMTLADAHENQLPKNQTSDAVKNTVVETAQSRTAFQDNLKAVAADFSATQAVKATPGQAAALTGPIAAAERTFQNTVMDQIVEKAAVRSLNGRSEIRIQLKPEFLGNVQMNIVSDKDQLMVRILTDQPVVKEIIETHLNHLKTELGNQGLTIDKFDITVNPEADQQPGREQFAQMFKNPSFQNGRRQAREQNPETMNRGDGEPSGDDRPKREGVNYFA